MGHVAGVAGFEPTSVRVKVWCLTAWLYPYKVKWGELWESNPWPPESQSGTLTSWAKPTIQLACLKGFEPPTHGLEGRCSILLSYRHRHTSSLAREMEILRCYHARSKWSGWWESDPRSQLGRLVFYHWTTPALQQPLHYNLRYKNCQQFDNIFSLFLKLFYNAY